MSAIGLVGYLAKDRVAGGEPRLGGGPYYGSRALRALGADGVVVVKLAEADEPLLSALSGLGHRLHWRPAAVTPAFAIDYEDGERLMVVEALGEPWTPAEARGWVAEALAGVEWVHVAPLARSDFPAATLAELARDRFLSLDGQGLVRPARTGPLTLDPAYDSELLRHLKVLKLAEEEALVLVRRLRADALSSLGVPEVVVTLGARGALVVAEGHAEHVPARPVEGSPDTTGAGDAFAAVYLAARAAGDPPGPAAACAADLVARLLAERAQESAQGSER